MEKSTRLALTGTALVITTPAGLEAEARRELREILPGLRARPLLLKGNVLAETDGSEAEAVAALREADTTYLSRVVPVQVRVRMGEVAESAEAVAEAAAAEGRISRGERFLVRCRRRGRHDWESRDLEKEVALRLERLTGGRGEYEGDVAWLVSVEVYQTVAYVGINRPGDVLRKTLKRQRKYAAGERPLNRAQWKIREAMAAFGIELEPGARVLDLGSAPGGWAAVLAGCAEEVVAVDPASLDPSVASVGNIRHLRCRAEELVDGRLPTGSYDLLTCDMNLDPAEAAQIVCGAAALLKEGARAVMTIKYMTPERRRHEREAQRKLEEEYEDIVIRRLPHNALETTAAMRRRAKGQSAEEWK